MCLYSRFRCWSELLFKVWCSSENFQTSIEKNHNHSSPYYMYMPWIENKECVRKEILTIRTIHLRVEQREAALVVVRQSCGASVLQSPARGRREGWRWRRVHRGHLRMQLTEGRGLRGAGLRPRCLRVALGQHDLHTRLVARGGGRSRVIADRLFVRG